MEVVKRSSSNVAPFPCPRTQKNRLQESVNLEPRVGIEPTLFVYETKVLPLYYPGGKIDELLAGIEPAFPHYQ